MHKDKLQAGQFYHIYNRGNNKENIFKEQQNYLYFLQLWRHHIEPVSHTHCYCLLPNHFHFLIVVKEDVPEKKISQAFSNCFNAYAKSINRSYNRTGSLFQERFGRKEIQRDGYYGWIIFYIHSNPQKHGFTKDFRIYKYSSYQSLLSNSPTLLKRNAVLEWFGNKEGFVKFHEMNQKTLPSGYLDTLEI